MDATYINNSIAKLRSDIYLHVRHRTLQKHTGNPIVDDMQLFYSLLPSFNGEQWSSEHYEAIITAAIMSSSLNAHGEIEEHDATSKEQQLTVLAGDYYSGRYYEILACSGNIALIKRLSYGVIKRCEQYVKAYEDIYQTIDEWLQTLMVIESELITQVFRLYHFDQYIPILQKGLLLNRLYTELSNMKRNNASALMKAIQTTYTKQFSDFKLEQTLVNQIEKLTTEFESLLSHLPMKPEIRQFVLTALSLKIETDTHITREV